MERLEMLCKKKAGKISQHRRQIGGGETVKEELSILEEKLVGVIGTVMVEEDSSIPESPVVYGYSKLDASVVSTDADFDSNVEQSATQQEKDDNQNFCGTRKKRFKESLAAKLSEKLINTQNEANVNNKIIAEKKMKLLERKVLAAQQKAAAATKIYDERKGRFYKIRMAKLNFL